MYHVYNSKCPICKDKIINDDIDFQFEGCQDEYSYCLRCDIFIYTKVRYFRYTYTIRELTQEEKEYYERIESNV